MKFRSFVKGFSESIPAVSIGLGVVVAFVILVLVLSVVVSSVASCTSTPPPTTSPLPTPTPPVSPIVGPGEDFEIGLPVVDEKPRVYISSSFTYPQDYYMTLSSNIPLSTTNLYSATIQFELRNCDTGQVLASQVVTPGIASASSPTEWAEKNIEIVWRHEDFSGLPWACEFYIPKWIAVGVEPGSSAWCSQDGGEAFVCDVVIGLCGEPKVGSWCNAGRVNAMRDTYIPSLHKRHHGTLR